MKSVDRRWVLRSTIGWIIAVIGVGYIMLLDSNSISLNRLCERSEAIHTLVRRVDCRVAALLAKTNVQMRSICQRGKKAWFCGHFHV